MNPFVAVRRDLHQIPEPGFAEFQTQSYLLNFLSRLPRERVEVATWRTGVLVRIPGRKGRRTIGYRADMDGLPIQEETSCPFRSRHPGFMHACGHDLHMAIALGVVDHFVRHPIDDHVLVVFQPAEEGPGGAEPMLKSDEFRRWRPDLILALHIAPEHPVGTIATKPGILFANTSELFIELAGKGGHAAFPHLANDAAVAAANLILQLQTVVSRSINPLEPAVVTIGRIEGGTRQNIIAETVRLEGTIRTLSEESMSLAKRRIEELLAGLEAGFGCRASVDFGANYVQVLNDDKATEQFMEWARSQPGVRVVRAAEAMTGEDFGYFLREIPGFMFWLGVDSPYGLHHSRIEPNEEAIGFAISLVTRYIEWKSAQAD